MRRGIQYFALISFVLSLIIFPSLLSAGESEQNAKIMEEIRIEMEEGDKGFDTWVYDPTEIDEIEKHTTICNGERKDLSCVKKNYPEIGYESEEHFWALLDPFYYAVKDCKPLSKVTEYLSFAETQGIDGAIYEAYSGAVSFICRKKPGCFRNAVKPLNMRTKLRLRHYVTHGLFWYISGQTEEDADRCGLPRGKPDWYQ